MPERQALRGLPELALGAQLREGRPEAGERALRGARGPGALARKGVSGCPKGSIMGKGFGTAMADDVPTYPRITIVNGGAKRVYFYTVLTNPARVQTPVVGKITKQSGKWSYDDSVPCRS